MGHVVPPQVGLHAQPLLGEQAAERARALQGASGVLPLPLPAHEQQRQPRPQPVEVLAVGRGQRPQRVVEVERGPALAPARGPRGRRRRTGTGPAGTGRRGAARGWRRGRRRSCSRSTAMSCRAAAVGVDPRDGAVDDPALVRLVPTRALLQRQVRAVPGAAVPGVDAVQLDPARPRAAGGRRRPCRRSRSPRRGPRCWGRPAPAGRTSRAR